jgi:DNA-binding response OmpR family regulator
LILGGKPMRPTERPPRILVVDDDRRVLELLDLALAHASVLTALDGEDASALDERPDLIVLDVAAARRSCARRAAT